MFNQLSELFSHYFIHTMSSSQKMCLRSDSFVDRFCDDLSEVILQYLPLKDKLRLECVSKQFQRTVFQKQNEIVFHMNFDGWGCLDYYEQNLLSLVYLSVNEVLEGIDPQFEVFKSCYYKPFESVLKKCPNIQSIDLSRIQINNSQISKLLLQMITKYCNHLIDFKGISINSNECESQEFCRKFGQKLRYFCSAKHNFDLTLFPNIETLEEYRVFESNGTEELLQLNPLNHLKKLMIRINLSEEHLLTKVVQKFQKLTHLSLWLKTDALDKAFKDFPSHQNLLDVFIIFGVNQDFEGMCDSLK